MNVAPGLRTRSFLATLPARGSHLNCCLSYVVNILLGFAYFARPYDVLKAVFGSNMSHRFYPDQLKSGGVKLPLAIDLCNFSDPFGTYLLRLVDQQQLSSVEIAHIQSCHLAAQLYFCLFSKSTHLMLAVHSIHHAGAKKDRHVLHCYALIWQRGWVIYDEDGTATRLSFSRAQQSIAALEGATMIKIYNLVAYSSVLNVRAI